jgi:glycosyltransferase
MTGDYFMIITDPFTGKGIISLIMSNILERKYDYSYGGINFIRDGKIVRQWSGRGGNWRLGWMAATPSLCMSRKIYDKYGVFNEKYRAASDYDLQIRIFGDKSLRGVSISQPLVNYIAGGTSNGGIKANLYCIKECQQILWDNKVGFAIFTNALKTVIALFAYTFASRKKISLCEFVETETK